VGELLEGPLLLLLVSGCKDHWERGAGYVDEGGEPIRQHKNEPKDPLLGKCGFAERTA